MENTINDVEVGQSSVLLTSQTSTNPNFQKSNKMYLSLASIYLVFVTVFIVAMFVPIFIQFPEIHTVSNSGIFGDTLRKSIRLKIMESVSMGCTLPMLSDKFLDQVTDKNAEITLSMWHRILFLVTFSVSSILYLNLSDYYYMAYLYIVLNNTKVLLVGAVTSYSVLSGTIMKSLRCKISFLIPVVIGGLRFVFEAYSLLFPEYLFLRVIATALVYLTFVSFFGVQIPWYYLLWRRYCVNKTLSNDEKKECVYMVAMLFYIVACQIVAASFGYTESWLYTGEDILVGYIVVQIVCILLATVLPTWFMRKIVQVSIEYLSKL